MFEELSPPYATIVADPPWDYHRSSPRHTAPPTVRSHQLCLIKLNAELYRRGYRNVVTFDKRRKRWTERSHYHYGTFTAQSPRGFDLVVGMHPDAASDHIIDYADRRGVPFALVPCCVCPSAFDYDGIRCRTAWRYHLAQCAEMRGFDVEHTELPITGSRYVLVGIR